MEFTIGIVTFFYNVAITHYGYGEMGLAAYLLIGYLMLIFLTLFLGMAEGLQPVFSHFMAAEESERNRALRRFSIGAFLSVGIVGFLLIFFGSRYFFAVFTPEDLELVKFTACQSPFYFWGFPLAGFNILMISLWQSTKQTGSALVISLLRSILLLPVLLVILPVLFSRKTVRLCHSLSETLTACCTVKILLKKEKHDSRRL